MPEFLNGTVSTDINGNNIYSGVTFADIPELLGYIRDTLSGVGAGWTVVLDDIATNSLLKMSATDGTRTAYINFSAVAINVSNFYLTIEGDVNGAGRTQNIDTDEVSIIQQVKANSGRLFITASDRNFNFLCVEKTLPSIPYYGGLPDSKTNNGDLGNWGYGDLHWRMTNKFLAEPINGGGDWRSLLEFYNSSTEATTLTNSIQGCYDLLVDRTVNLMGASQSNAVSQSAYKPEAGALGINGEAEIEPLRLKRGQVLQGTYTHVDGEATPAYDIGYIEFAVTGMASLPAGDQVVVTNIEEPNAGYTAKEYVRRTYVTGDQTYQGFLINEERQSTPFV